MLPHSTKMISGEVARQRVGDIGFVQTATPPRIPSDGIVAPVAHKSSRRGTPGTMHMEARRTFHSVVFLKDSGA